MSDQSNDSLFDVEEYDTVEFDAVSMEEMSFASGGDGSIRSLLLYLRGEGLAIERVVCVRLDDGDTQKANEARKEHAKLEQQTEFEARLMGSASSSSD